MVEDIGYEAYIYEQCDSPAKAQKKWIMYGSF